MKFHHFLISISLLFSLAVVGESHNNAHDDELVVPGEDYWQALWPNTPIPSALRELLKPGPPNVEIDNLPMGVDDTQYPKTFFLEEELYPGNTMRVEFSKRPFAQPYGVYTWLKDVKDVEREGYTFEEVCVRKAPAKGERKYCARSLGTLIGFAVSKLGKDIRVLSSAFAGKQHRYSVEGVQSLGGRAVMCHRLNFQKVVFYCHEINQTRAFRVQLADAADDATTATTTEVLAVCHADTSGMNHEMLEQIMKGDPGNNPVCHFLGNKAVLWVPTNLPPAYNYKNTNILIPA